uniref:Uncharacterized protein n=1 Tax=Spyridia filamentosa TaxID=196632 RepID=A0A1Z1MJE5_SPYFI|nr:hypothetical protein [Spyridia filamentosa]ARW66178.1 hypothetical protein [Spyridia filamentosa]
MQLIMNQYRILYLTNLIYKLIIIYKSNHGNLIYCNDNFY